MKVGKSSKSSVKSPCSPHTDGVGDAEGVVELLTDRMLVLVLGVEVALRVGMAVDDAL